MKLTTTRLAVRYYVHDRMLTPLEEAARRWSQAAVLNGRKKAVARAYKTC